MRRKLPDQAAALARREPLGIHNGMLFPRVELSAPARGGAGTGLPVISAPATPSPCPRFGDALSAFAPTAAPRPSDGRRRHRAGPSAQDASAGPGGGGEAPRPPPGKLASRPAPGKKKPNTPRPSPATPKQNKQTENAAAVPPCPGRGPPRRGYSPPSWTGLIAKLPGCAGGSHSRSPLVLSLLLDRHPRPESWLLGGENTASEGKRENKQCLRHPLAPTRGDPRRSALSGKRGQELCPRAC